MVNVTTTGYTNTGLVNGTTYYYVVSALNAFSESANSTEASATPASNQPLLMGAAISSGHFGFWIEGSTGPDYVIETSTDLSSWIPIWTNISPSLPYFWVDTNSVSASSLFYRLRVAP